MAVDHAVLREAAVGIAVARTMTSGQRDASHLPSLPQLPGAGTREWKLVDSFDWNGGRYLLMRQDPAPVPSPKELTQQERTVVALLARGQRTKEIAHHLGRADTTIRVLIMRAARKLGARTRQELLSLAPASPRPP